MSISEIQYLEIFDVFGSKVHSEKIFSKSKTVNVEDLPSGIYLVRVNSRKNTITKKLVVR